jgi:prophage regulatory protein
MSLKKYLRASQIVELTGLSRATIYALEKKGDFPKKVPLGARAVAWKESEIEAWLERRDSVIKTGREAKPGRPPTGRKPKVSKDVSSAIVAANIKGGNHSTNPRIDQAIANSSEAQHDEWGQSGPSPSEEEIAAVQAKLAAKATQASKTGKGIRGKVNVLAGLTPRKATS